MRTFNGSARTDPVIHDLARFRYNLRKFLRFSEKAARAHGVTPQQHQLLLGVAGFTGRGWATVSELAEFLQERHHSVGELVKRAQKRGLVRKAHDTNDRRFVFVSLTRSGQRVLAKLASLHKEQVGQLRTGLPHVAEGIAPRASQSGNSWKGKVSRGRQSN